MKQLGSTCLCVALLLFCATGAAEPQTAESGARAATQKFDDNAAVKRARAFTMWMAVRSDHVQRWMWEARYKEQHLRRRCLNARLSRLHAIERQARAARSAVEAAVRTGGLTGYSMVRLVRSSPPRRGAAAPTAPACASRRSTACGSCVSPCCTRRPKAMRSSVMPSSPAVAGSSSSASPARRAYP